MDKNKEIIDNLKIVCQCMGIKKGTFKKLLSEGKTTVEQLQKATGADSGDCGGNRCGPRLAEMVKRFTEIDNDSA